MVNCKNKFHKVIAAKISAHENFLSWDTMGIWEKTKFEKFVFDGYHNSVLFRGNSFPHYFLKVRTIKTLYLIWGINFTIPPKANKFWMPDYFLWETQRLIIGIIRIFSWLIFLNPSL